MPDFRTIERELAEYFRREGVSATSLDGDVYLGICSTQLEVVKETADSTTRNIVVLKDPNLKIVSLTRLARELAESVA